MLHKDFTPSNMRSKYLSSTIYAGTPRHEVSRYVNNATLQLIEAGQRISYYSDKYKERKPAWKSNKASGAPDDSSLSHFSAMTRPSWLGRAVRNRHRHAIEQASRRWRGGRGDDSARTRRKVLISTQVRTILGR